MSAPGSTVSTPLRVDALTIEDGLDIAMWRSPGPWTVEDSLMAPREDEGYWAVRDAADHLVGYCCFGEKARPIGLPAKAGTLDVALGIDPGLAGQGISRTFATAVIDHGRSIAQQRMLRTAVPEWNRVGRHTTEAAGFQLVGTHEVTGGRTAIVYNLYEM